MRPNSGRMPFKGSETTLVRGLRGSEPQFRQQEHLSNQQSDHHYLHSDRSPNTCHPKHKHTPNVNINNPRYLNKRSCPSQPINITTLIRPSANQQTETARSTTNP